MNTLLKMRCYHTKPVWMKRCLASIPKHGFLARSCTCFAVLEGSARTGNSFVGKGAASYTSKSWLQRIYNLHLLNKSKLNGGRWYMSQFLTPCALYACILHTYHCITEILRNEEIRSQHNLYFCKYDLRIK